MGFPILVPSDFSVSTMILDSLIFVLAAGPIALVSLSVWRWLERRRNPQTGPASIKVRSYPKDKVIVFTMGPSAWCPSASPFVLKLQTYLRMAGIAYKNETNILAPSSKGKFPWILYQREKVEDTCFIIDHLNKTTSKDLNSRLSVERKAISRAFQKLIEDELYWIFMVYRFWNKTDNKLLQQLVPAIAPEAIPYVRRGVMADAWANGVARHSEDNLGILLRKNLDALCEYIGSKPYLMGASPSEVDASLFGLLAQARWQMPNSLPEKLLKTEFSPLGDYCDRVRDVYFPDWNDLITHGGTRMTKDPEYVPPVVVKKGAKEETKNDKIVPEKTTTVSAAAPITTSPETETPPKMDTAKSPAEAEGTSNPNPVLNDTKTEKAQTNLSDDKKATTIQSKPETPEPELPTQNGSTPKMSGKSEAKVDETADQSKDEEDSSGKVTSDSSSTNARPEVNEEGRDRSRPRKKFGKLKRGPSKEKCKQS